MSSGLEAVTAGSSWRKLPAAALRGLANGFLPCCSCRLLSCSNPDFGINTSPRTSSITGGFSLNRRNGILSIVRTFCVTSSPVSPSPRVAARTSTPSSYSRLIARPSSLGSTLYSMLNWWLLTRSYLNQALRRPLLSKWPMGTCYSGTATISVTRGQATL